MTRPMKQGVSCVVCNKQRAPGEVHKGQSKLLPKTPNYLICNTCVAEKKEPRAFIIIVARTKGFKAVEDYIKNHRYYGPPILGTELV